jgi:hypothetical protein
VVRKISARTIFITDVSGPIRSICHREILLLRLRIFPQRNPNHNAWSSDSGDKMEAVLGNESCNGPIAYVRVLSIFAAPAGVNVLVHRRS